jgi:hypothetical protein
LALDFIVGSLGTDYSRSINPLRSEGRARATMLFRLGELIGLVIGYTNNYSSYAGYLPTKCIAPDGTNFGFMQRQRGRDPAVYFRAESSDVFGLKPRYFASNLAPCDERDRASGRLTVGQAARASSRLKHLLDRLPTVDERRSFISQVFERYFGLKAVESSISDYLYGTGLPYGGFSKYAFFYPNEADYLEGRSDTLPPRPIITAVKPGGYGGVFVGVNNGNGGTPSGDGTTGDDTIVGYLPPDPTDDPAYTTPVDEQTTTSDEQPAKKSSSLLPLLALGIAAYFATKE